MWKTNDKKIIREHRLHLCDDHPEINAWKETKKTMRTMPQPVYQNKENAWGTAK
jgi:hypothetical protein